MPGTRPIRRTTMRRRLLPVRTLTALLMVIFSRLTLFTSVILSPTHSPACSARGTWLGWAPDPALMSLFGVSLNVTPASSGPHGSRGGDAQQMQQGCGRHEGPVTSLWLGGGTQRHQHESAHSCPSPSLWPHAAGSKWWVATMKGGIAAAPLCHWKLPKGSCWHVPVPTGVPQPVPLTSSAALLHLADKDAQPVLGAATDAETQLAIHALLHRDGIDDVALIAAGCGDRTCHPGWVQVTGRGVSCWGCP